MIDVHCHLEYFGQVRGVPNVEDGLEVAKQAKERMDAVVSSVADPKNFDFAIKVLEKFSGFVFLTAGIHPFHGLDYTDAEIDEYIERIKEHRDKFVAIGEVGLDYHMPSNDEPEGDKYKDTVEERDRQKINFRKFIKLAKELDKPIVIHVRNGDTKEAMDDCWDILADENMKRVVVHCFSGKKDDVELCVRRGYYMSIPTLVFKSNSMQKIVKKIPLSNLLLETDSPWLDPFSPKLVNRPWKISYSAGTIANLLGVSKDEVVARTTENAKKVFGI